LLRTQRGLHDHHSAGTGWPTGWQAYCPLSYWPAPYLSKSYAETFNCKGPTSSLAGHVPRQSIVITHLCVQPLTSNNKKHHQQSLQYASRLRVPVQMSAAGPSAVRVDAIVSNTSSPRLHKPTRLLPPVCAIRHTLWMPH